MGDVRERRLVGHVLLARCGGGAGLPPHKRPRLRARCFVAAQAALDAAGRTPGLPDRRTPIPAARDRELFDGPVADESAGQEAAVVRESADRWTRLDECGLRRRVNH